VENHGDHFEVLCEMTDFDAVVQALEKAGIATESAELAYLPQTPVPVSDADTARQILRLIDALDDLEDVKSVFANYEIDDELLGES